MSGPEGSSTKAIPSGVRDHLVVIKLGGIFVFKQNERFWNRIFRLLDSSYSIAYEEH